MKKILILLVLVLIIIYVVVSKKPSEENPITEQPATIEGVENRARAYVGVEEGVDMFQVQILSSVAKEWPDSCLGLASADEMCATVITSGYEIQATVNGKTYTLRTNEDASVIRESK